MARNRRNVRRRSIKEFLNMKTFLTIIAILMAIIIACVGVQSYRQYTDKQLLAKQSEELAQQTEEIFSAIQDNINQTNKNISETDEIIEMSAVGDILCSEAMIEDAYDEETDSYDFSHMFSQVSSFINKADIVMGTMETNFTSGDYTGKNAPTEFAQAVKDSGINLVTISHNHSLDYGTEGLEDTKETLEELGFSVVGDTLEEDNSVLIKSVKDVKIGFLTYTYGVNDEDTKTDDELSTVSIYSEEKVTQDIATAEEQGAEYICVLIHWGNVITETVSDEQKEMADFLVDSGVDMILGAHPSVVQPMEIRENSEGKNVFIAYSIGTYISTLSDDNAKIELVLNIELRKSGTDGEVYLNKVDYTPIYVLDNGTDAENRYELIDMKSVASSYAEGDTSVIDRETYDKLIEGLDKLEELLT